MDPEVIKQLSWPKDRERLKGIQEELKNSLKLVPLRRPPSLIAGVDASFFADRIICVASLFTFPGLELIEEAYTVREVAFPYIWGYLSFREGPAILEALGSLTAKPDLLIFDGQGIAHPRGIGLAAFMGALLNMPSIGCAKSRLVGEYAEPGKKRGQRAPLTYKGVEVGAVLRTQDNVRPVFVSPGNMIDIEDSVKIVLQCAPRYRLTEQIRRADAQCRKIKNGLRDR